MFTIKIKTLPFAFLVLFTVLIVSCKQDPVSEYGNALIDSYVGSKKAVEQVNLKNLQRAVQMYRVTNGEYPETLEDIEGIMDSPIDFELYQYNPENGELKLKNK